MEETAMALKIKGIDISRAQEKFDFDAAIKAGVKYVIIRAGIRSDEDSYFRQNLSECLKRNIPMVCTGISRQRLTKHLGQSLPLARKL